MIAIKMQSGGEQCECNHLTMTLSLRKQQPARPPSLLLVKRRVYLVLCNLEAPWQNSSVLWPLSQRETDLPGLIQAVLVRNKHACKPALQPPWLFVQRGIN